MTNIYYFVKLVQLADELAAGTNGTVYVPDLFAGEAMNPDDSDIWGKLPTWLKTNAPQLRVDRSYAVLDELSKTTQKLHVIVCKSIDHKFTYTI